MKHKFQVDMNTEVEKFSFVDQEQEQEQEQEQNESTTQPLSSLSQSNATEQQPGKEVSCDQSKNGGEGERLNPTTDSNSEGKHTEGGQEIVRANFQEFYNSGIYQPAHELQQEKPYHRLILLLLAKGLTVKEIHEETGWHESTIHNLKKQPWAQKYIAQTMESLGRRIVEDTLRGAAANAAKMLVDVMEGTIVAKVEQRIKAANDILERAYPVSQSTSTDDRNSEELSDAEIIQRLKNKIA